MTDYILRRLNISKRAFTVDASFEIMGIQVTTQAKLDLGASRSIIPLRSVDFASKLGFEKEYEDVVYAELARKLTEEGHVLENVVLTSSIKRIGAESPAVYYQTIPELVLDGAISIPVQQMLITVDTMGYVLIGMDILTQLEIHCGESIITDEYVQKGDYILLAEMKDRIKNDAYADALRRYMGLSRGKHER